MKNPKCHSLFFKTIQLFSTASVSSIQLDYQRIITVHTETLVGNWNEPDIKAALSIFKWCVDDNDSWSESKRVTEWKHNVWI